MIISLIVVLLTVAVYLATGWKLAVRDLRHSWARVRQQWHGDWYETERRRYVKKQMVIVTLFWPYLIIGLLTAEGARAANRQFDRVIDRRDPERPARELAARDATDLRQAGMSDPPGRMGS